MPGKLFKGKKVEVLPDMDQAQDALFYNAKPDDPPDTVIMLDVDVDGNVVGARKTQMPELIARANGRNPAPKATSKFSTTNEFPTGYGSNSTRNPENNNSSGFCSIVAMILIVLAVIWAIYF